MWTKNKCCGSISDCEKFNNNNKDDGSNNNLRD